MNIHIAEIEPRVNRCSASEARIAWHAGDYEQVAKAILKHDRFRNLTYIASAVRFCDIALDGHGLHVVLNLDLIIQELEALEGGQ